MTVNSKINFTPWLTNYLPNQRAITLFATYSTNQLAITVSHTYSTNSVLLQFSALFMVTSKQHNTGLIAHSSMELKV